MAKDPAFLFYPGDYLRDTQTLSEKSQVAYDRIMCEHMRNICISKQQLKFFTKKLNDDELDELMFVLTEKDEGYQIEWVSESIVKRREYSESRRNNRKKKPKKDMKTYDEHMENEDENEDIIKSIDDKKKKIYKIKDNETFFENEAINNVFHEYLKLRVKEKFTMSEIVTDRLIKKLREYSNNNINDATEIVMKAITGKWKDFYELK